MSDPTFTHQQKVILAFLRKFIESRGYPPTRIQIAKAFNFKSANAAQQHLEALKAKGAIRLDRNVARGIVLVRKAA